VEKKAGTVHGESKLAEAERARQARSKVKSMLIILFDNKWIVPKEFVLAGQTVNSAYCCDVLRRMLENVRRLRPELWREKNWLLHHRQRTVSLFLFHKGIFDQKRT
jgi:hypothetical protein